MENQKWLMERILHYAQAHDFTKYTSTLLEAWRLSISGLSDNIIQGNRYYDVIPELKPDDDYTSDPLTTFGILEAKRHRARGVSLSMFLGLMKYYRQTFLDLVREKIHPGAIDTSACLLFLERCFDRIEIAFIREWHKFGEQELIANLQSANRTMTNEKNIYLTVFESLTDPVIIMDTRHCIRHLNHAALLLLKPDEHPGATYYNTGETDDAPDGNGPVGRPVADFYPWLSPIIEADTGPGESRQPMECDVDIRQQNFSFEVTTADMRDVSGKFAGKILSLRDITERKKAEKALRESEARYRSLFHNTHAVMMLINSADGKIIDANEAAAMFYGYDHETLKSMKISDINILTPEEIHAEMTRAGRRRRNRFYFKHRLANGDIRDVEVYSGPVVTQGKTLLYSIINDVTDRKKMENALKASNRELDDFAYIASHDLREPLRGIANYATFLIEDYGDVVDADGRQKLETLVRLCKREEDLIQSLLTYSRLGRTDLRLTHVDTNHLVADIKETLVISHPDKKILIKMPRALPEIKCDAVRMQEVFANLLSNAVKYNDNSEAVIEIGFYGSSRELPSPPPMPSEQTTYPVFYIQDNGIGIREQHLNKIFGIFKRLHGRDKYGGGTGVGLTIVKKIIERHGGIIRAESTPGQGTTFYFTTSKPQIYSA